LLTRELQVPQFLKTVTLNMAWRGGTLVLWQLQIAG
jgi:hypothetical protein